MDVKKGRELGSSGGANTIDQCKPDQEVFFKSSAIAW